MDEVTLLAVGPMCSLFYMISTTLVKEIKLKSSLLCQLMVQDETSTTLDAHHYMTVT